MGRTEQAYLVPEMSEDDGGNLLPRKKTLEVVTGVWIATWTERYCSSFQQQLCSLDPNQFVLWIEGTYCHGSYL